MEVLKKFYSLHVRDLLRRILLAWLLACTLEYLLASSHDLSGVDCLRSMSLLRVCGITAAVAAILQGFSHHVSAERWAMFACVCVLSGLCLIYNFSLGFLAACLALAAIVLVYALRGCDLRADALRPAPKEKKRCLLILSCITAGFFLFVSVWTVCRVYIFYSSTYDLGLFSQMFYSMKTTGLPITTLERATTMSHFQVHVSPIYYLMLPFYCIYPSAQTLQVLQAAVLASAVIPLWKIGRLHGLKALPRLLVCAALLLFPAYSGGTDFDLHENCFLTPLILWTLYGIDSKKISVSVIFGALTLTVKEDAAVYVAVLAIWLILKTVRQQGEKRELLLGFGLLIGAIAWFLAATSYLQNVGDGVMSYRYNNFIYDGSSSLFTVIKAVLMCPMKALAEAFEPQKLNYVLKTMLPVLFLPLFTRKYERFVLLIPYFLVNLMSDYKYQYDLFFQYSFGSAAFLIYLTAINLADLKWQKLRAALPAAACAFGFVFVCTDILPAAQTVIKAYRDYHDHYERIEQTLALIPEDATVTSGAFYTPQLSEREIIYDVFYCSTEQLLSTEYVALDMDLKLDYRAYATKPDYSDGLANLIALLEANGYEVFAEIENELIIYKMSAE